MARFIHSDTEEFRRQEKVALRLGGAAPDQEGLYRFESGFSEKRADYYLGKLRPGPPSIRRAVAGVAGVCAHGLGACELFPRL